MKKTIFLHMTKTAGGSIKSAIAENYPRKCLFGNSINSFDEISDDVDLIFGHLIFGAHKSFPGFENYITFVRHPLTRTISHYYQLKNVDNSKIGVKIKKHDSINDFFSRDEHWEFQNFMCKIISGYGNKKVDDNDLYEKAIGNIDTFFSFVGIQEYMDLSLLRLSHIFGKKISVNKNVNIGSYNIFDINRKTLNKILEQNQLDLKLYKNISSKFLDNTSNLAGIIS